jgi:Zn-dependent protease with chaperone function
MQPPRTGEYFISPKELSPSWLLLYLATFALQVPCAAIRGFVAYPVIWLLFKLLGQPTTLVHLIALVIGYGPLAISLATLVLPLGSWWWEQQAGGRSPSEREQLVYQDALAQLRNADPGLREPRRWFVLDEEIENAGAYADTLMVTRGLLDSGYLEPVLAHELGHLNTSDGRLTAALCRITTPPRGQVHRGLKTISFLATGAIGMWPLRAAWGAYWRSREHHADHYAAHLGQASTLGEFLDERRALIDLPVPFIWLSEHSHPPTEHRVDRLARAATHCANTPHAPRNHARPGVDQQPRPQQAGRQAADKPKRSHLAGGRAATPVTSFRTHGPRIADRSEPVKGTPSGPPDGGS